MSWRTTSEIGATLFARQFFQARAAFGVESDFQPVSHFCSSVRLLLYGYCLPYMEWSQWGRGGRESVGWR